MIKTETISAPPVTKPLSSSPQRHQQQRRLKPNLARTGDDKTQHAPSSQSSCSNKISDIHRHLINLRAVVLLYISQYTDVILAHEIDRHTLQCKHTNSFSSLQSTQYYMDITIAI